MSGIPFAALTPTHVGRVGLVARDAQALADYYRHVVGLDVLARSATTVTLGAGDRRLLEIEESAAVRQDDPRAAGLYHTAFLLPSRSDLGRWIRHAVDDRLRMDGAADHLVSEAVYLTDPEGNGIEVYVDRPARQWPTENGRIRMANDPLDVDGIVASVPAGAASWNGVPAETVIGHVHLRVGDVRQAEEFWNGIGFDTMVNYGSQAVFLATGGYHHHVAANSWQSRGARGRDPDRTGLAFVEFHSRAATKEESYEDPWRNVVRVAPVN